MGRDSWFLCSSSVFLWGLIMQKVETSNGFIGLHRKILDWEWYDDANTFRVFIHCLLRANHKSVSWHGITIERGSFVSSYLNLAQELKISVQRVRTALKKLKSTNEITYKATRHYSIITVNNYNSYQPTTAQGNNQSTTNQQPINNQSTTNNNENNDNNENKNTPIKKTEKKIIEANKLLCNLLEGDFKNNSDLKPIFEKWFAYKNDRKEQYKSEFSIKAFVKKIIAMSNGDYAKADALVENAIANNWQGVFGSSDAKFLEQKRIESKTKKIDAELIEKAKQIKTREEAINFVYKTNKSKLMANYGSCNALKVDEIGKTLFRKFEISMYDIEEILEEEMAGDL